MNKFKEKFAAIAHETWADWQKWVHKTGTKEPIRGDLVIPQHMVAQWQRQIDTPYADLSEEEKQGDRDQVDRYWPLIRRHIGKLTAKYNDAVVKHTKLVGKVLEQDNRIKELTEAMGTDIVVVRADGDSYGIAFPDTLILKKEGKCCTYAVQPASLGRGQDNG